MRDASAQLHLIATRLREAGERDIRLRLLRTLRAEAQPVKKAVQSAALSRLPKSGGLAQREADAVKVQVLTSARSAGVRFRNARIGAAQTDKGYVRHPVIGTTSGARSDRKWTTQTIPGARGWWSVTLAEKTPEVSAELTATIRRISAEIQAL